MRALLALLMLSTIAHAEPTTTLTGNVLGGSTITNWHSGPTLIISESLELFRLESGGCLRGPLVIRNSKGVEMFRLDANVYYPAGCR